MKTSWQFAVGFALCAISPPASAQSGSTACLYMLLAEAHEMTSHCGDALDDPAEQRYSEAILALKTHIIENDPRLKAQTTPEAFA